MRIVILGLSITSSWGNGHATTYRGLVRELCRRGHDVLFLERDVPWYAANRDLPEPPYGRTGLYSDLQELRDRFLREISEADFAMVGSYVPEGCAVGDWVISNARGLTAFYDIDTPVTLGKLERGETDYICRELVPRYRVYLSFTGGPTLARLGSEFGSPRAKPLYCSVDPELYYPEPHEQRWDLGYLGTYSEDRQPALDRLLIEPARRWVGGRFVAAGPQYPESIAWPSNVERIQHISPADHRAFYNSQRFALNVTRAEMAAAGYSPSVRLFEAAACAVPVISDWWEGLDTFFRPGSEIVIARTADDVLHCLRDLSDAERGFIGARARARVLAQHTAAHRAGELENIIREVADEDTASAGSGGYSPRAVRSRWNA